MSVAGKTVVITGSSSGIGAVDVLVNNAAHSIRRPITEALDS